MPTTFRMPGKLLRSRLLFFFAAGVLALPATCQQPAPYTLSVSVDEVNLTFHAADAMGRPATNLGSDGFHILDNGRGPLKLVRFEHLDHLPIRVGLLFDTSRSMLWSLEENRKIARFYALQLLRPGTDLAYVERFDFEDKITQNWTDDAAALVDKIGSVAKDAESRMGGTRLFDALYRACRDQRSATPAIATGNFILLFTDGLDNASNSHLDEVVSMCQETRTSIYVVSRDSRSRFDAGQKVLGRLTAETGGTMTFAETEAQAGAQLAQIRRALQDEYRVVYKPASIKRDGKFHKLKLDCYAGCQTILAPAGYYAPR